MFFIILIGVGLSTGTEQTELEFYEARDIRGINFGNSISGQVLNIGVFLKVDANTEADCAFKCASVLKCFSYNFYKTSQIGSKTCELSDRPRFGYGMESVPNSIHRGIKTACDNPSSCGKKEYCSPNIYNNTYRCKCQNSYYRTTVEGKSECVRRPKTCLELFQRGVKTSGVYHIEPTGSPSFLVFCDMETDGGGWIVLQRRRDNKTDFDVDWNSYKKTFGDLKKNFWLGNDNIHILTMSDEMVLRFDLEDFEGARAWAEYQNFTVLGEENNYTLFFGDYKGNATDSLKYHYGMKFSTRDKDVNNCSTYYKSGWWFKKCHRVNINGLYFQKGEHLNKSTGINWFYWKDSYESLKTTEMKIRPKTRS